MATGNHVVARRFAIDATEGGVLRLHGELDGFTAPHLLRRVLNDPTVTVLDMHGVTFLDMRGVTAILVADRARSTALTLRAPSPRIRRVLELVGVADHLVVDDEHDSNGTTRSNREHVDPR